MKNQKRTKSNYNSVIIYFVIPLLIILIGSFSLKLCGQFITVAVGESYTITVGYNQYNEPVKTKLFGVARGQGVGIIKTHHVGDKPVAIRYIGDTPYTVGNGDCITEIYIGELNQNDESIQLSITGVLNSDKTMGLIENYYIGDVPVALKIIGDSYYTVKNGQTITDIPIGENQDEKAVKMTIAGFAIRDNDIGLYEKYFVDNVLVGTYKIGYTYYTLKDGDKISDISIGLNQNDKPVTISLTGVQSRNEYGKYIELFEQTYTENILTGTIEIDNELFTLKDGEQIQLDYGNNIEGQRIKRVYVGEKKRRKGVGEYIDVISWIEVNGIKVDQPASSNSKYIFLGIGALIILLVIILIWQIRRKRI